MISLLIYIIVLLIVFGVLFWAVDLLTMLPPNFRLVIRALLALVLVLILINLLLGSPIPLRFPRSP